jgi:hypothetical protein
MTRLAFTVLAVLTLAACAPVPPMIGADPAAASADGRSPSYRSPFKDYVKFAPIEPRSWRETNDRVRDLGGPDPHMLADSEDDPMPQPRGR